MTGAATAGARPAPHPVRAWFWAHPEWWAMALAGAGWAALAAGALAGADHGAHGGGPSWPAGAMVTAMMVPLVVPHVRFVAGSSLWRRRHAAVGWFLVGYLGLWAVAQAGLEVGWAWASGRLGQTAAAAAAVAAAALWEVTPAQLRRRRRCHRLVPLAPRGWRADAACARYGVATGARCLAVCWAAMLVCAAFGHGLPVVAAVFGVQLSGRYRPRPPARWHALVLLGVGAAALAWAHRGVAH